ncbi:hypothetical protein EVAR_73410_1 [Eumeta japonica]|uniref:Secreted protein n=1 Tax=Eumeta variegata TaxID=151549 RepID=A0A4C1SVF4_EUMVA|nr:hypothetical protein EVAR_73410_1 [Eumeta japonica]
MSLPALLAAAAPTAVSAASRTMQGTDDHISCISSHSANRRGPRPSGDTVGARLSRDVADPRERRRIKFLVIKLVS